VLLEQLRRDRIDRVERSGPLMVNRIFESAYPRLHDRRLSRKTRAAVGKPPGSATPAPAFSTGSIRPISSRTTWSPALIIASVRAVIVKVRSQPEYAFNVGADVHDLVARIDMTCERTMHGLNWGVGSKTGLRAT